MTRRKGSVISVVFADVDPEMDDEWNRWYNEEHIPDLLKMPGYLDAARYEAVRGSPRYLAIYEHEDFGVFSTPERNAYRGQSPGVDPEHTGSRRSSPHHSQRLHANLPGDGRPGSAGQTYASGGPGGAYGSSCGN